MTDDKRKTEPPFKLDMAFGEALERFIRTKPSEVADSIDRSKTKKLPGANVGRPSQKTPRSKPSDQRGGSNSGDG